MLANQPSQQPLLQPFDTIGAASLFLDTGRVILRGWRVFVPLFFILTVIWFIQFLIDSNSAFGAVEFLSWLTILAYLLSVLGNWITIVAAIAATDSVSNYSNISLGTAYRSAIQRFWPYLLTFALTALYVLEGSILFVIPGIVLLIAVGPAVYVAVLERLGPRQALARSRFLTVGNGWKIFFIAIVFWLSCLLLFWIPLAIAIERPDWRWLKLPPVNFQVWGSDAPDPAWFLYVTAPGTALWSLLFTVLMVLIVKSLRAKFGEGFAPPPRWPAAVIIGIGLVLLALAIPSLTRTTQLTARAKPLMGILAPPTISTYEVGFITLTLASAVTARYTTPDGVTRELHSFFTLAGLTDRPYGASVPVLFDPENPSEARINGGLFIWGDFGCKVLLGSLLLVVGLSQWRYFRRTACSAAREPLATGASSDYL